MYAQDLPDNSAPQNQECSQTVTEGQYYMFTLTLEFPRKHYCEMRNTEVKVLPAKPAETCPNIIPSLTNIKQCNMANANI